MAPTIFTLRNGDSTGSNRILTPNAAPGVARQWEDELSDPRQDIYTLADGEPVNEP